MSTAVVISLIEKLKEIQAREGLSDYKFADKLGVSPQLWQMTRTGKRDIGSVILKAVAKTYPELNRDVLIFLGSDASILSNQFSDLSTTPPQTTQDGKLAVFRGWLIVPILGLKRLFCRGKAKTDTKS